MWSAITWKGIRPRLIPAVYIRLETGDLSFSLALARRLLPVYSFVLHSAGVNGVSSLGGASVGMDTTSGNLAMRVLRDLVAGGPSRSVPLGSGWCSADARWADPECVSSRG